MSDESKSKDKTNWKSIYITTAIAFVGGVQYYIYFSALWPYLETIDETATEAFFGYIVAMYAIGQIISSTALGYCSNRIKQVKLPIFVGLISMVISNLIFLSLPMVPFPAKYLLLLGKFIDGIGSSNAAMLRLYVSTASTIDDREMAIGYFSCGQAGGAILGPVIQLAIAPLGYPGIKVFNFLGINMYTSLAYCAIFVDLIGIIILFTLFKEKYAGVEEENDDDGKNNNNDKKSHDSEEVLYVPPYDKIAVAVCLVTRFAHTLFLTNIETIGSAFSMHMFAFSHAEAVKWMAASQIGASILTFFVYLAFTLNWFKRINLRIFCVGSIISMISFYLLTYSWPFISGEVTYKDPSKNSTEGCNTEKFDWCEDLSQVNLWLYYILFVGVVGIGFSTMNVALITLYSEILGPRRQGTLQGIFQISSASSRMLGPFVLGNLYDAYGPKMTWKIELGMLSIAGAAWIAFYRKMVPLKTDKDGDDTELKDRSIKSKKEGNNNGVTNEAFDETD